MTTIRSLRNRRLVEVDERGRATFLTCSWLVQVPSGNPEPDSEADCWTIVECGAPLFAVPGYEAEDGWRCAHGHEHVSMQAQHERAQREADACTPGQQCHGIDRLCTRHQAQYQRRHGRASNE